MKYWLTVLFLLLPALALGGGRVALFDYDRRTVQAPGVQPYLAQQLRAMDPSLTLTTWSAEGDRQRAMAVLDRLDTEEWDLIITITTDAFQLALHRLSRTPFVFTNVNNPKALGIADQGDRDRRFTGASYYVPVQQQLAFFKQVQPAMKRLGFLFDPTNRSMLAEAQEVREACLELGLEFHYRRVGGDDGALASQARALAEEGVDAVVATSSDRLYLGIKEIERGLASHPIPIYSFNAQGVDNGAVAALASDHHAMVDQLVIPRVRALLNGQKRPAELSIGYLEKPTPYLNPAALARFGLTPL